MPVSIKVESFSCFSRTSDSTGSDLWVTACRAQSMQVRGKKIIRSLARLSTALLVHDLSRHIKGSLKLSLIKMLLN
jgi:hypothetical protein